MVLVIPVASTHVVRGSTVQAIKDVLVLPNMEIQLCVFYVLKAIVNGVGKYYVSAVGPI